MFGSLETSCQPIKLPQVLTGQDSEWRHRQSSITISIKDNDERPNSDLRGIAPTFVPEDLHPIGYDLGGFNDQLLIDVAPERVPSVPSHLRS